jgi:hypothetical protein
MKRFLTHFCLFVILMIANGGSTSKTIEDIPSTNCSPNAIPVWELGCYTWWAEKDKVQACQENPDECCGTTLEEHCQKCTCSDGTVVVDSVLTGATCSDLCYYYDHQIEKPEP